MNPQSSRPDPLASQPGLSRSGQGPDPVTFPVIEGYDIIDLIGRGGMGAVYEAFQQSTGRRVAVKLMIERAQATEAAKRRFEREVELIARLQHPGIVSVLDSGLHRSRYFYVMEHVEGRPLDDAFPPGRCDVRAALGVIAQVARAVDYAHQRGVMHRDLKPSNILIDERGEPRLLDFGLAKAFDPNSLVNFRDSLSEPGQVIGTLGYMSPEQARGAVQEVSVRSDVYSLGAIAYEMVTGSLPCAIDGAMALVFHRIENRDPDRPSSKRKGIDADADAVLLRALEKSPAKRYPSASAFADDVERWLGGRSVAARRVSAPARAVRWCRRNPAPTAVIVALTLLAGAMGVAFLLRSQREQAVAQREQAVANTKQMLESMMEGLGTLDPDKGPGLADTARPLIDQMERSLSAVPLPAEFEAIWRETLGEQQKKWGLYDRAEASQLRALELRESLGGGPDEDLARCLYNLGGTYYFTWKLAEAEACCRRSLDIRRKIHAEPDSMKVADSLNFLAQSLGRLGRFEEAERLQQEEYDIRLAHATEDPRSLAASRNNYATLRKQRRDFAGAERIYREAMTLLEASLKEQNQAKTHRFIARSHHNIATCMIEQGRLDDAESELDEADRIARDFYYPTHPDVALIRCERARLRVLQGRFEDADRLAREALAMQVGHPSRSEVDIASTRTLLGDALGAQQRWIEAEAAYAEALPVLTSVLGADHAATRACKRGLDEASVRRSAASPKTDAALGRN